MLFKDGKVVDKAIGAAPSDFYEKLLSKNQIA